MTGSLAILLFVSLGPGIEAARDAFRDGHATTDFERFEATRQQGGRFVGARAEPGDVVETCYGWIAFEALEHPLRETCPLATRIDPGPPTWIVESYQPEQQRAARPPGTDLVETFRSPRGETFVYRVTR